MTTAETGRNTEFERPLSPVEKVIWRLNEGASLNVTMICRIRGALAEDVLREALDRLQQRHPYLRVRVEDSAQGLVYRVNDVPTIPLRVRDVPADGWLPIVEEEINRAIPSETGPLVRCIHLRHREELSHLLVTFHHVIGDAMSGAYMVRDILAAAKGQPLQPLSATPSTTDTIPMDLRLPAYTRGLRGVLCGIKFELRSSWQDVRFRKPDRMRLDAVEPPHGRTVRVYSHELDSTLTRKITDRARHECTSVHGALSAAMCLAVAADVGEDEPISMKFRTPVNVRRFMRPPVHEDLGFFASMVFFRDRVSSRDDFWDLARRIRVQIQTEIDRGTPCMLVRLMPLLYRLLKGDTLTQEQLASRWRDATPSTCGITNIGRLDIETQFGELNIDALHFAVAPSALADFSCTASSVGGRMNCNFLCPEPVFDRQHAQDLVTHILNRLEQATS